MPYPWGESTGLKEAGLLLRPRVSSATNEDSVEARQRGPLSPGSLFLLLFEEEKGWVAKDLKVRQTLDRGKIGGKRQHFLHKRSLEERGLFHQGREYY